MMSVAASGKSARPAPSAHVYSNPLEFDALLSRVGGKAATLGRMIRAGVRVPPGFVLTTRAFDSHLDMNDLRSRVEAVSAHVDPRDPGQLRLQSQQIRTLILGTKLSRALRDELFECTDRMLARGAVVVRSSAIGEDSAGHSFAGQLDSILNVTNEAALERAVLECWASYWSERALVYCTRSGVTRAGMGVVIQQQVEARAAGVMFTDAGDGSMLVEYAAGLGDALVSGAINPGRLSISRETNAIQHIAWPPHGGDDLLDNAVDALVAVGTKLEQDLGGPQDVEWALDHRGALFIVQSRPITAPVLAPGPSALPVADKQVAWSNANINENFPGPVSPLLYSIASVGYTHYFRNLARAFGISKRRIRAMEPALREIIGVHGARMYYNLSSIHSVLRLAPFGKALTESFDTFVGADGSDVNVTTAAQSGTVRQIVEVAVIAAKTTWQFLLLGRRIVRFESTVDRFAARTDPTRLATMSIGELRAALGEFMDIRRDQWLDASLADAASMVCYGALERMLRFGKRGGNDTASAVSTSLLKAIPDVISGEPVHQLWALSRLIRADRDLTALFEQDAPAAAVLETIASTPGFADFETAFRRYLDQWGFRCSEELMLTSPSFQENPAPLIGMLRAYTRIDGESPDDVLKKQETARVDETKRVLASLSGRPKWRGVPGPTYAHLVSVLLPWTHAAIRFRERARMKQSLLYSRCRRIVLAMGEEFVRRRVLSRRDDIFFLTIPEIDELASGAAMFARSTRELVAMRGRAHAALATAAPPDAFTLGEGEYLTTEITERGRAAISELNDATDGILSGTSACGGSVTGRATVLRDVTEAATLERGDILVTKQTDPGWAPVFFLISGLVIERGGMLSHGAIIAREFGIPCVVGVHDAMNAIPSGATITVDGDTGHVHVRG